MIVGLSGDADQIQFVEQCSKLKDAAFCSEASRAIAAGSMTPTQASCELACSVKPMGPDRAQCIGACYGGSSLGWFKSPLGIAVAVLAGALILTKVRR